MPTYLTPGVYVEEVPSANKPIEGVSTSVAAFVGLTPGGPVNTPMRISNWTQFAKIFGDPNNPDNGPFMEGTYMAHSVYGFFQNGGSNCWIVRVGEENGAGARPQAALPAATDKSRRGLPRPGAAQGRRHGRGRADRGAQGGRRRRHLQAGRHLRQRERGVRGPHAQEGPQQRRDEGQRLLEAHQDRGHRRVAPRGAACPGNRQVLAVRAGPGAVRGQPDPLLR